MMGVPRRQFHETPDQLGEKLCPEWKRRETDLLATKLVNSDEHVDADLGQPSDLLDARSKEVGLLLTRRERRWRLAERPDQC